MDSLSTPAELARKAVEDLARETGERIRSIRGSRSQIEFAELLGIGRTTLIRYESGERQPDVEFIVKLNLLFNIQPLWLMTGKFEATAGIQLDARERSLIEGYRNLEDSAKAAVDTMLKALLAAALHDDGTARGVRKPHATAEAAALHDTGKSSTAHQDRLAAQPRPAPKKRPPAKKRAPAKKKAD